jgi:hypothetical protein
MIALEVVIQTVEVNNDNDSSFWKTVIEICCEN